MPLTDKQRTFINFVEEWWYSHHDVNTKVPTATQIRNGTRLSAKDVADYTKSQEVTKALENRGIILADISQLLPEQLAAANVILDFSDSRSQKKKLEELGVTTQRYNGWLKQERFQRYMRSRAEALLGETQHEAHTSLLRNVQRGDLNSIKLYYEMTGRWSSKTVSDLNVEFILIKVVEAVQKYVKDPLVIQQIAGELSTMVGTTNNPNQYEPAPLPPITQSSAVLHENSVVNEPVVDEDDDMPVLF